MRLVPQAALSLVLAALATGATAAPPPVGSEDYQLTAPYSDWFRTLRNVEGELCCTLSDCRPVQARVTQDGHWEFLADPKHFTNGDNSWVRVPDDRVLRRPNPVGQPIACYVAGFPPFCFLPADAV
jgi:hypothetical protein